MDRKFKILDEDIVYLVGFKNETKKFVPLYKTKEDELEEALGICAQRGITKPTIIKIVTQELNEIK